MDSQFLGLSAPDSDCLSWQGHIWLSMPMEVDEKNGDLSWNDFVEALLEGFLPHDDVQRTPFDQTLHFELGDPHATGGAELARMKHLMRWEGQTGYCCSSTCCSTVDIFNTMMLYTSWLIPETSQRWPRKRLHWLIGLQWPLGGPVACTTLGLVMSRLLKGYSKSEVISQMVHA